MHLKARKSAFGVNSSEAGCLGSHLGGVGFFVLF